MASSDQDTPTSFAYQAQTHEGQPLSGVIDAPDADAARRLLESLRLRVLEIEPAAGPTKTRPLRSDEFAAFNQQLAYLAAAGMPIERGLRVIAQDVRSGRLAETLRRVAHDLESGKSLSDAFETQRSHFPPLYGRLMDAGVKTGKLPAMLFNLGRHLELIARLRATLWRTAAYPLVVFGGLAAVMVFLGLVIVPRFRDIFKDFDTTLPALTQAVFRLAQWTPHLLGLLLVLVFGGPLIWLLMRRGGFDQTIIERFIMPLPVIGPILKRNLLARWCDTARLAVAAGLDMPAAIELAGDAIGSTSLQRDGARFIDALQAGQPLGSCGSGRIMPATIAAAIDLGATQHDLATTLQSLSDMYQEQAEIRLGLAQVILSPVYLVLLSAALGVIVLALFLPLVKLIQSVGM